MFSWLLYLQSIKSLWTSCGLRPTVMALLLVPKSWLASKDGWASAAQAPQLCGPLLDYFRQANTMSSFKGNLKAPFYHIAFSKLIDWTVLIISLFKTYVPKFIPCFYCKTCVINLPLRCMERSLQTVSDHILLQHTDTSRFWCIVTTNLLLVNLTKETEGKRMTTSNIE